MNDHAPDQFSASLDELRSMIGTHRQNEALKRLRALHVKHPDSIEVHVLLLHALAAEGQPAGKFDREISELMDDAPQETADLLRFCELLFREGDSVMVEGLLEEPWRELFSGPADAEAALGITTLLARALLASGRRSSALDLIDETRERIPMPALTKLRAAIAAEMAATDESPMAELHAVRRKMLNRHLEEGGEDTFAEESEIMEFYHAFQLSWNEAMKEKPLPYGMMPEKMKTAFLGSIYARIREILEEQTSGAERKAHYGPRELTDDDLATITHFIRRSEELFEHPMFGSSRPLLAFASFIPNIMARLRIPLESIDDFLAGETDPETMMSIEDSMGSLSHLVAMRMADTERHYRAAWARLYDIFVSYRTEEEALDNIDGLCEDIDEVLSNAGIPVVRFVRGGSLRARGSVGPPSNKKRGVKKGKKPKRR